MIVNNFIVNSGKEFIDKKYKNKVKNETTHKLFNLKTKRLFLKMEIVLKNGRFQNGCFKNDRF